MLRHQHGGLQGLKEHIVFSSLQALCSLERSTDGPLDEVVRTMVHIACGLIKDQDLACTQQRTCHTQQLALAHRQVSSALLDGGIQTRLQGGIRKT